MMRNRSGILILKTILCFIILLFIKTDILASSEINHPTPIFDGYADDGKKLNLMKCDGYEITRDEASKNSSHNYAKHIKSRKWKKIEEVWVDYGMITIERWYFEERDDAICYPFCSNIADNLRFFKWPGTSEVADKSFWSDCGVFFFAKDKVLVRINVNPPELGKDFTIKIAKNIEKKL
jgi:hypothetical protein